MEPVNLEPLTRKVSPGRAAAFPLVCAASLAVLGLLDSAHDNETLRRSIVAAAGTLPIWSAVLIASARRSGRTLTLDIVARSQHYLQARAQASVRPHWGRSWTAVYHSIDFIAAQL